MARERTTEAGYYAPLIARLRSLAAAERDVVTRHYLGLAANVIEQTSSELASIRSGDETDADEIVTRLYRRFKDWHERGFGPDDVTWCEVKADVLEMFSPIRSGVTEEMVERGARALFEFSGGYAERAWNEILPLSGRDRWRLRARAVLAAALAPNTPPETREQE